MSLTAVVWLATGALFAIGLAVVVFRRQLLAMLLGLELMLAAVNVSLVHHAGLFDDAEALAVVALVIAVAAAEAVVGLALILRVRRGGPGADAGLLTELRG
ncbi:MAG: NADH-quinone oxidoreductase subunit NuoK [Elusimicrobiota bacterium]|nr:MAG: NADH-quinone oxidoreductase subunit NuoK [Elusimicrobiota bacterium]